MYQFNKFKYLNSFMINKKFILVQFKIRDRNTMDYIVNIYNRKFEIFDRILPLWTLSQMQIIQLCKLHQYL